MNSVPWAQFAQADPDLAEHVRKRLGAGICFLATSRPDGWPRVHPIGPAVPEDGTIVVGMLPTSPKGHDLLRNGRYALHCVVEDGYGGGGEVLLTGTAAPREPTSEQRQRGWVAFELLVGEVLTTTYDHAQQHPVSTRWKPA